MDRCYPTLTNPEYCAYLNTLVSHLSTMSGSNVISSSVNGVTGLVIVSAFTVFTRNLHKIQQMLENK